MRRSSKNTTRTTSFIDTTAPAMVSFTMTGRPTDRNKQSTVGRRFSCFWRRTWDREPIRERPEIGKEMTFSSHSAKAQSEEYFPTSSILAFFASLRRGSGHALRDSFQTVESKGAE